uniref:Chromo domain-containing protein n=1 Tax=Meloidogyne enterolobii TaxID=390850 RepID=A0A6V7V4W0_MELEN|nr:unnamed protein product [Meloidogyne enterolobii]
MAPKRSKKTSTAFSSSKHNNQFVVEAIVNKRITIDGKIEYLLKWEGHSESEKSWEPETNLNCSGLIEKFNKFQKRNGTTTSSEPVEEIIGVTQMDSEIYYLMKYIGTEKSYFFPSQFVKINYAELVIKFFETRYTEDR